MISAKILADSITDGGSRLVTWEWVYPRCVHSEIMTHRVASKNSASSRAIPAKKLRQLVIDKPFTPINWGQNQAGMQAGAEIADIAKAQDWWSRGRDLMVAHHEEGERLGLHKQIVNRVIEPWMLITIVTSMTDHANLFHLRKHPAAEPHFQELARQAWELFHNHMPTYVPPNHWHLPFITDDDYAETWALPEDERVEMLRKVSTGRCARVSYLSHLGVRDLAEDVALHDKLAGSGADGGAFHGSPFEHPAMAVGGRRRIGNFEGWKQYRKFFEHEAGPDTDERCALCGCWGSRHVAGCAGE